MKKKEPKKSKHSIIRALPRCDVAGVKIAASKIGWLFHLFFKCHYRQLIFPYSVVRFWFTWSRKQVREKNAGKSDANLYPAATNILSRWKSLYFFNVFFSLYFFFLSNSINRSFICKFATGIKRDLYILIWITIFASCRKKQKVLTMICT